MELNDGYLVTIDRIITLEEVSVRGKITFFGTIMVILPNYGF